MLNDAVILVVLLFLSGFFSSTEMAYVVSNKLKIELRARKNNIYAKYAHSAQSVGQPAVGSCASGIATQWGNG